MAILAIFFPNMEKLMTDLNSLMLFARVAEAGSFSEAARRTGVPISTVSRKLAELEGQLGVRLIERSTRSLRLTDVGLEILEQAQRGTEISDAVDSIASDRVADVRGLLRLSAPPSISDSLLVPMIIAFQSAYPAVEVRVMVTDRYVDPIAEGVDLVLRFGALQDSSMIARPLLRYRHRLLASPDYLRGRPTPTHPDDLRQHRLLAFSAWSPMNSWTFEQGKTRKAMSFRPHLAMNDYTGLATALLAGAGIGDMPAIVAPALVAEGRLVEVMPEWQLPTLDLSIVHLGNRHIARPVRLFKEFAVQIAPTLFPGLSSRKSVSAGTR